MENTNRDTLEYVVGLAEKEIHEVGGRHFSKQRLNEIIVEKKTSSAFHTRTLSGLVTYLKANFDECPELIVHIENPSTVKVFSPLNKDKNRDYLVTVEALLPRIAFDTYHSVEEFNILLQSSFVETENRALALKVVGNIKSENVQTFGDDGTSQTVKAKAGIATIADVVVPNPITLSPYRTFVEVPQPESNFVLRLKDGPQAALFEADGGAWRNKAMASIHAYLSNELKQLVETNAIVIIG